jgi:hypothetical protein
MAKTIENLFRFLHLSTDILIIVLFFTFFKRTFKEKPLLLIALYESIDLLLNLSYKSFSLEWYPYIWSTFTFIEYSIFASILWTNMRNNVFKKVIIVASIVFIVFATTFNIETNFNKIDSIPIGVETILILIFSFYYLYEQMNDSNNLFIYNKYIFWIVIGFMIYLAGSFFFFLYASIMEDRLLKQYWFLTNCSYVIMNILFVFAIFINNKSQKKSYPNNFRPYLN